jgi:hypothetical protein
MKYCGLQDGAQAHTLLKQLWNRSAKKNSNEVSKKFFHSEAQRYLHGAKQISCTDLDDESEKSLDEAGLGQRLIGCPPNLCFWPNCECLK